MHKNTRQLHIHLLSHWWDLASSSSSDEAVEQNVHGDGGALSVHKQPPFDFTASKAKRAY